MTYGGRRFIGKVVLVTSGSPGMGRTTARGPPTQLSPERNSYGPRTPPTLVPNYRRRRAAQAAHGIPVVFSRSTWAQPNRARQVGPPTETNAPRRPYGPAWRVWLSPAGRAGEHGPKGPSSWEICL